LDVGSGKNYFVSRLLEAGYDAHGIDVHSEPVFAKDNFYRNIGELPYESFDVIVLLEVVEHLISPLEEIEHFTEHLSPNGKIFLSTVIFHEGTKDSTNWYINPRFGHVTIWSMKSLSKIFLKFGFESASIYRSGNLQIWDRMPSSIINSWDFQGVIYPIRSMIGHIRYQIQSRFHDLF
jgi:SAM-dependent methyltransferase